MSDDAQRTTDVMHQLQHMGVLARVFFLVIRMCVFSTKGNWSWYRQLLRLYSQGGTMKFGG